MNRRQKPCWNLRSNKKNRSSSWATLASLEWNLDCLHFSVSPLYLNQPTYTSQSLHVLNDDQVNPQSLTAHGVPAYYHFVVGRYGSAIDHGPNSNRAVSYWRCFRRRRFEWSSTKGGLVNCGSKIIQLGTSHVDVGELRAWCHKLSQAVLRWQERMWHGSPCPTEGWLLQFPRPVRGQLQSNALTVRTIV